MWPERESYERNHVMDQKRNESEGKLPKYGARVYRLPGKVLIKQTVLRGKSSVYVIHEHREAHVADDNDAAIAKAIRDAVSGRLPMKKEKQ